MDYPFYRQTRYDVNNDWWFPPIIFSQIFGNFDKSSLSLVNIIESIPSQNKFKYLIFMILIILFFKRLQLSLTTWISLIVGCLFIFYLNEKHQIKKEESDQYNIILNGPFLQETSYFENSPELVLWIGNISD